MTCIADDETPLWECPCRECWKLEMEINDILDIPGIAYDEWVRERTP